MTNIEQKFEALEKLIGNTPMAVIDYEYKGQKRTLYAKLEQYNLSGSIKDRIALHILREAYKNKLMDETYEIAEATSGNTGIAISAVAAYLGNKMTVFMPDFMSEERKSLIKTYGAQLKHTTQKDNAFAECARLADKYAEGKKVFLPHQFSNTENSMAHFTTTGPEVFAQMQSLKVTPDAFVSGIGSGGTIMGIGNFLKTKNPNCKTIALEPKSLPTVTNGCTVGDHEIAGIGDGFIPEIVDVKTIDEVILVDDKDAINMSIKLAKELGLAVGISSGANFIASAITSCGTGNKKENLPKNIATVFADDNKKYLSKNFLTLDLADKNFISNQIKLIDFKVVK